MSKYSEINLENSAKVIVKLTLLLKKIKKIYSDKIIISIEIYISIVWFAIMCCLEVGVLLDFLQCMCTRDVREICYKTDMNQALLKN